MFSFQQRPAFQRGIKWKPLTEGHEHLPCKPAFREKKWLLRAPKCVSFNKMHAGLRGPRPQVHKVRRATTRTGHDPHESFGSAGRRLPPGRMRQSEAGFNDPGELDRSQEAGLLMNLPPWEAVSGAQMREQFQQRPHSPSQSPAGADTLLSPALGPRRSRHRRVTHTHAHTQHTGKKVEL